MIDGAPTGLQASPSLSSSMSEQMAEAEQADGSAQDQLSSAGSAESVQQSGVQLAVPLCMAQLAEQQQLGGGVATEPPAGHDGVEPKRQICFDFTKNQCTRGAACKFSHDVGLIITVNSQEKGICFDFLKGLCTRGLLCRFSHDLRNLQTPQCTASSAKKRFAPICYDFVKNQCTRGEDCKYSHDYSSILYGPRAPGKDPYVICVDFTRGKCARGASCRYSHIDPSMLSGTSLASPNVHPALLAAGLGAAAAAAAVAQTNTLAGTVPGALAGLNAPARQPSELQAQAALLLSGFGGNALLGAGLPGTPVTAGGIPAAWNSMQQNAALQQQSPEGLAALLEQLQLTALSDSLAQLSPTAGDAASLSALSAALMAGGGGSLSPTYASSLAAGDSLAAAAALLQTTPGSAALVGMLDAQQQAAAAQLYGHGHADAAAVLLQSRLSDASQLSGLPGSAPVSATPTPTAGAMAPTVFQQHRPSTPTEQADAVAPPPQAQAPTGPPKSQPLMSVYHPMLQHKAVAVGAPGLRADILVDARGTGTGSPTIGASWGAAGGPHGGGMQVQQSALAQQLKQHAGEGLPPPVHLPASRSGSGEQQVGTPVEMACSYDQMQMIWGQSSIWGQRQ